MSDGSTLVYIYDNTFDGLLCCIFESYTQKEMPINILPIDTEQIVFYKTKLIETNEDNATRVLASIERMGESIERIVRTAFLFGMDEKAYIIFKFIKFCYKKGPTVYNMLQNEIVAKMHAMVKAVQNEKHLLTGFIRFAEVKGGLVAFIDPKHYVIPLLQGHFTARFNSERFLIFDRIHKMALIYQPFEAKIIHLDDIDLEGYTEDEQQFQTLWAGYFKAIAIKERANARCQMGLMPKRFWKNMLETQVTTQALQKARENIGVLPTAKLPHLEIPQQSTDYNRHIESL